MRLHPIFPILVITQSNALKAKMILLQPGSAKVEGRIGLGNAFCLTEIADGNMQSVERRLSVGGLSLVC